MNTTFATHAAMTRLDFWGAVDVLLNCVDQPNALWNEELLQPYIEGLSVGDAFRRVLDGRKCR
jgi:hypothetical protein